MPKIACQTFGVKSGNNKQACDQLFDLVTVAASRYIMRYSHLIVLALLNAPAFAHIPERKFVSLATYDAIGQLTVADSSVSGADLGYAYDAAWNLHYRTNNSGTTTVTVDSKNQLSAFGSDSCYYDSNGNLVAVGAGTNWLYVYDDENRLSECYHFPGGLSAPQNGDPRTVFNYDGLGRLRTRVEYIFNEQDAPVWDGNWLWVSEARYVYDGMRVIQERDSGNNPLVSYTRGNDLSGSLEGAGGIGGLLGRTDGSGSTFYHADGRGNITYLVDGGQAMAARYDYDSFGNATTIAGTLGNANVYRFSSKEVHTNSGMYYYGARFYDPNLQRWPNRDPIGEWGGMNLYGFVYNNPHSYVDPDGLAPQMTGFSYDLNSGAVSPQYVDQKFGQDYGIGLHGPAGSGAEAAAMIGVSMVPGVGEAMDVDVLLDPESRWWEKTLSAVSLGANALTEGLLPNVGGILKSRRVCKEATRVTGEALEKVRKEFERLKPKAWMEEAATNPQKYTPDQLARMRKGQAPIGPDGFPMEVHHRQPLAEGGANSFDNFEFLSRSDHRLGENYKLNHPNLP